MQLKHYNHWSIEYKSNVITMPYQRGNPENIHVNRDKVFYISNWYSLEIQVNGLVINAFNGLAVNDFQFFDEDFYLNEIPILVKYWEARSQQYTKEFEIKIVNNRTLLFVGDRKDYWQHSRYANNPWEEYHYVSVLPIYPENVPTSIHFPQEEMFYFKEPFGKKYIVDSKYKSLEIYVEQKIELVPYFNRSW